MMNHQLQPSLKRQRMDELDIPRHPDMGAQMSPSYTQVSQSSIANVGAWLRASLSTFPHDPRAFNDFTCRRS